MILDFIILMLLCWQISLCLKIKNTDPGTYASIAKLHCLACSSSPRAMRHAPCASGQKHGGKRAMFAAIVAPVSETREFCSYSGAYKQMFFSEYSSSLQSVFTNQQSLRKIRWGDVDNQNWIPGRISRTNNFSKLYRGGCLKRHYYTILYTNIIHIYF